jgi:general stress protein 26
VSEKPPARSEEQRKHDTLKRLETDDDAWVASADRAGSAHLVPLSYLWDGATLLLATSPATLTGRNLRDAGRVRMAIGPPRDVVMLEGTIEIFTRDTVPVELADAFAARHWDARLDEPPYLFFRVTPRRIQAWREVNELPARELMRDGRWLV